MKRYLVLILTTVLLLWGLRTNGHADTVTLLHQAAHRYEVPNSLLLAIAYVESKGVLTALNIDGRSVFPRTWEEGQQLVDRHARENLDVGLMQVNIPAWSGRLRISPRTLYQPQVNLPVAAYVLRRCIDDSGGDLWKGVGCYHSPRLGNQRKYVSRVWSAYTTLRQRGLFGPTLRSTSEVEREPSASVVPIGTLPQALPQALPAPRPLPNRAPAPALGQWRPTPSGVPACPGQRAQYRTAPGKGGLTLVFFRAGQAWPSLAETPHALIMGVCVDCRLSELVPLSTALGYPVQVAAPALLSHLQVTCLPTVMQLTASTDAADAAEVRP